MKELVILSGKGGTGKTSLAASLAALSRGEVVVADCDVDAPNLHLLLQPTVIREHEFCASEVARIDAEKCTECGTCRGHCRFDARDSRYTVEGIACEGCGFCALVCPSKAITLHEVISGRWFSSDTAYGPMVHARLNFGEGNSGKLVTTVKQEARDHRRGSGDGVTTGGWTAGDRMPGHCLHFRSISCFIRC